MQPTIDWKDVLIRAVKTFAQTAVSYVMAALNGVDFFAGNLGKTFWVGLALSTGAAGLSAAWNGVIQPVFAACKQSEP
jgi:hypothetical protein